MGGADPIAAIALLIPITALMIPIVAILTMHQRKMAEMMRQRHQQESPHEIAAIKHELQELRQLVNQQAIQMDDFLTAQRQLSATPPPAPNDLQNRIGS